MPLRTVAQIAINSDLGITHVSNVFKPAVPAATVAGGWVDTSMSSGTPKYNAYVGSQMNSTAFVGSRNNSINVGSKSDYLLSAMFQTRSAVAPAYVMILDYLMFYPLADLDSTDIQETAVVDVLPRYADGKGVQIMPVITLPSLGFTDCTIVYTNSDGVANRTTTFRLLQGTTVGSIAASAGLKCRLQQRVEPALPKVSKGVPQAIAVAKGRQKLVPQSLLRRLVSLFPKRTKPRWVPRCLDL